jgi:Tol biopolymer transport system component
MPNRRLDQLEPPDAFAAALGQLIDPNSQPQAQGETMTNLTNHRLGIGLVAAALAANLAPVAAIAAPPPTEPPTSATPTSVQETPTAETASVSEDSPPPLYFLDVDTGERTALTSAEGSEFRQSPDGTRMLLNQDGALSIANADGSSVVAIDVHGGPEWVLARWSPDGMRVVYQERLTAGSDVGNLFVHEIATGRRTQVTHLDLTTASWFWLWPSFSPDGQNVVFHLARDGSGEPGFDVWSVPITGGDPELLVEDAAWPRYLPDGRLVYVASPRAMHDGETLVIAAADGSTRTLAEAAGGIRRVNASPGGARVAYVAGDPDADHPYVVAVESGEASMLEAEGEWVDDHTLLIGPD